MNLLVNGNIKYNYAGFFVSSGKWIHPERIETTYEIIAVVSGTVHLFDGKQGEIFLQKGDAVILEPNICHRGTEYSENVKFYWIHFSPKGGNLPFEKHLFKSFGQGNLFRELLHSANLPNMPEYAVNATLTHILSNFCLASENENEYDRRAEEIGEWIRINASAKLRAEDVSEYFGFSKDHLSRILKNTYGYGFKEISDRFIMAKAREMLCNTELYIKEIASSLGFPSDKAFCMFFKYHQGISPNLFRNRFSKIHMNNR